MLYTTLNVLDKYNYSTHLHSKLLIHLNKSKSDDEQLSLLTILDVNGFNGAVECFKMFPEHKQAFGLFIMWCTRQCQPFIKEAECLDGLDVLESYINGEIDHSRLVIALVKAHDVIQRIRNAPNGELPVGSVVIFAAECILTNFASNENQCQYSLSIIRRFYVQDHDWNVLETEKALQSIELRKVLMNLKGKE